MRMPAIKQDWIGVRWGLPCSVLFHLAIAALALLVVPEPRKPKALPLEIPVEIVRKAPEKKPPAKPQKQARKAPAKPRQDPVKPKTKQSLLEPKPQLKKPEITKKLPVLKPEPPKAEARKEPAKPPQIAEKKPEPAPVPKIAEAEPPKRVEKKTAPGPKPPQNPGPKTDTAKESVKKSLLQEKTPPPPPAPRPPTTVKEPQLALGPRPPVLRPKPAPPPKPKSGSLKVPPELGGVPHPNAKQRKLLGQWVLTPLVLNTGHRCGKQRVTGTMNLVKRRVRGGGVEIQYLAEIRTTIRWERCRPEGALRQLVLVRRGDRVFLIGAQGVLDHGLMQGNLMVLRDPLGDSYWRKRR